MSAKITLHEAARKAGISPSTVYHWIKNGLLPRPEQVPNIEKGRGVRAVFPESILNSMTKIKKSLKESHSIKIVKRNTSVPETEKKSLIQENLKELTDFVKSDKYNDQEFEQRLANLQGISSVSSSTAGIYIIHKEKEKK